MAKGYNELYKQALALLGKWRGHARRDYPRGSPAEERAFVYGWCADELQPFLDALPALKAAWEREATMAEHKSHVDFENELYATLVDPLADGPIKEAEMRKQLLESTRWYRQHAHDLETQLNSERSKK